MHVSATMTVAAEPSSEQSEVVNDVLETSVPSPEEAFWQVSLNAPVWPAMTLPSASSNCAQVLLCFFYVFFINLLQ